MKQTAVEWLYNNLKSHFEHDGDLLEVVQFSFEQAKAMEKEQIMKTNYSYNEMKRAFECGRNFQLTGENNFQELIEELNQALPQADVSGSLGFDKGYEQGYNDATKEACQEIAKNYQPNDR
jgi:hypothetical protein